ncbi:TPA: hypothetical protein ACN5P3_005133, partial [Citrobacter freundii]
SALELYESTRGIWANIPKDERLKFAYATYGGLVMEVYEIQCWVKAGSQQYFTRDLNITMNTNRSEFVGRIAAKEVRDLYVGKLIKKTRSHGSPFVKVGIV